MSRVELPLDRPGVASAFRGFKDGYYKYEFLSYFDSVEEKDDWLRCKREEFGGLQELAFHQKGRRSCFLPLEYENHPPSKIAADSAVSCELMRTMVNASNMDWMVNSPASTDQQVAPCDLAAHMPISPPRTCQSEFSSAIATPVTSPSSASEFDANFMRIEDPEADLLLDSLLAGDNDSNDRYLFESDNIASSSDSGSEDLDLVNGIEERHRFAEV